MADLLSGKTVPISANTDVRMLNVEQKGLSMLI